MLQIAFCDGLQALPSMYLSEKLAFVELHKTGGSHIGRWLANTLPGEQVGKHNRLAVAQQSKFVIGSIRNPWDWYVSLWAYGCSERGSVWKQTTDAPRLRYYRESLPREMGMTPGLGRLWTQWQNDRSKPRAEWQSSYANSDDPECFRRWLKLALDPERALDLREGFGFSWIARSAGLLTYRYVKLFTNIGESLYDTDVDSTPDALIDEMGFVDAFVRTENLENDLVAAIDAAGVALDDSQRAAILESANNKTNTSKRRSAGFYYDAETLQLIAERERTIITRHGYTPPSLESSP